MSIRLRLAVVFAVASALVFALGSWLFIAELSSSLLGSIDSQLAVRLDQAPRYLATPGGAVPAAGSPAPGEYVVQIIDSSGRVRGASADAGTTPMLSAGELTQARHHRLLLTNSVEGERERLMAAPLAQHLGWVAVAGVSLEAFDGTLSNVTRELLIAGAIFVAAAGLGAYGLARAALSPVERMRREVAALSERDEAPGVQVPRTRDEIAALARTMNQLLGRLQRALARQRALVADASHELRTPFAVLRGELELAGRPGRSRTELAAAVARASDEVARLAPITEQLLFLARSDEDRIQPRLEPTNIRALLTRSAEHAASRASSAGVWCQVEAPAELAADLDPDRIRIGAGKQSDILVLGVDPDYLRVRNLKVLAGRFFDSEDSSGRNKVGVITEKRSEELYGAIPVAIGQIIKLSGGLPFTIVGVFKESVDTFGQSDIQEETMLIP